MVIQKMLRKESGIGGCAAEALGAIQTKYTQKEKGSRREKAKCPGMTMVTSSRRGEKEGKARQGRQDKNQNIAVFGLMFTKMTQCKENS